MRSSWCWLSFSPILVCLFAGAQNTPLRVSVTLVQVDAVVTDRDGRPVTGLTKDDFELFEDGKPRAITHFSFVTGGSGQSSAPGRNAPAATRAEDVRRIIVLLVDDLQMSFASLPPTREALHKFIDRQMEPGDLVAVLATSGNWGPLNQFTTDKRMLHAAINRVRFSFLGSGQAGGIRSFGLDGDPVEIAQVRGRRFAVGTLGMIRYVTEGMRAMPGRKSLVVFSDGFAIRQRPGQRQPPPVSVDEVRGVTDQVNRSAVVIYSVDARRLAYPGLTAADDVGAMSIEEVRQSLDDRATQIHDTQEGLRFLAEQTGGLAHFDNNDINLGLQRMLEDQSRYYLLGFQPAEEDAARMAREGKYHRLTIRVKRPGLLVRYRNGFMGEPEGARPSEPRTPEQQLVLALRSPFSGAGVRLRLTPMFALGEKGELILRALVHIDGSDLSFSEPDAEGYRGANVNIVSSTSGEDPKAGGTTQRTYTIRARGAPLEKLQREGLVYAIQHQLKKAGAYHMRIAVQDATSGRIGSASRFIEVPDLSKGSLAISEISMHDGDLRLGRSQPVSGAGSPEEDPSPAVRVFRRQSPFSFAVIIYNAHIDSATRQPAVSLHARLYRGDQVVWEGKPFPAVLQPGVDPRRIPAGSVLTLGEHTPPGDYVLEMQAVDNAAKGGVLTQSIDFELR